jgi:dienelactone hydrolase
VLQQAGLATLLCDLLTAHEDQDPNTRFNIDLLTTRVIGIIEWLLTEKETSTLTIGLFGASTGAAAALSAAAELPDVHAVVSRGGRPDLAMSILPEIQVPVLLIVGGEDTEVLELNRQAYRALRCERELKIVEGATHLFPEEGALEAVSVLACDWFVKHLEPAHVER